MMRQTLILAILHSQVCRGFVFSPNPMENSVEDIPLEFNDESLHIVSQEIMEQKTENEFDDKVHVLFVVFSHLHINICRQKKILVLLLLLFPILLY